MYLNDLKSIMTLGKGDRGQLQDLRTSRHPQAQTPVGHQQRSPPGPRQQRAGSVYYNQNCASETHSMAGGGQNPDSKSLGEVGTYLFRFLLFTTYMNKIKYNS